MNIKLKKITTYPISELLISHSTMASADSCMRKLEFSKLFGFNLRSRSAASDGGNALHAALGVFIATRDKQAAILELMLQHPTDLCDNPLWKWSIEACYGTLLSLIAYFEKHTELEIAIINDKQAIEVPFSINILHNIKGLMPVKYRGFIDFVVYNRLDNEYFVIDLKTSGMNLKDFTPMFKYSPQCLPYGLVLANALGKDFSNLHVQYLIAKVDLMNTNVFPLDFYKTQQDVEEWTRDLYTKLVNIKTYIDTQWFPRKAGSCITFNRPCAYFELCQSRNLQTINLMLESLKQPDPKPFPEPWISLDLEIV